MPPVLALETGHIFTGRLFGAPKTAGGEVVFHTGMTGYQEIVTDPSYAGQIIVFTAPHIGNYGIHAGDYESARIHAAAVIVRDHCRRSFHHRAERSLDDILRRDGIPGLCDVDTRALTIQIRRHGTCRGIIGDGDPERLVEEARALPPIEATDWVERVTTREVWEIPPAALPDPGPAFEVAVLDFGVKRSILTRLASEGCRLRIFPARTKIAEILAPPTEGVFLSNGPGDPASVPDLVANVRELLAHEVPIFGICLGHQLLSLALGGPTIKLPFGHHGANHPVRREHDHRVEITSQNHNYAVPVDPLPPGVRITHLSLNDGTVEGMEVDGRSIYSVQYHPEAAPGPRDSHYLFRRFRDDMARRRGGTRGRGGAGKRAARASARSRGAKTRETGGRPRGAEGRPTDPFTDFAADPGA